MAMGLGLLGVGSADHDHGSTGGGQRSRTHQDHAHGSTAGGGQCIRTRRKRGENRINFNIAIEEYDDIDIHHARRICMMSFLLIKGRM